MAQKSKHEFSFEAPRAKSVAVAGTFNEWNPASCPMHKHNGGPWKASVPMPPGRHEYRFVVDGRWVSDPRARQAVQNEFGETNSVMVVPEPPPSHQVSAARRWWKPWAERPGKNKKKSDASLLHAARNKIFGVLTPRMEFPSTRITDRKGRGIAR